MAMASVVRGRVWSDSSIASVKLSATSRTASPASRPFSPAPEMMASMLSLIRRSCAFASPSAPSPVSATELPTWSASRAISSRRLSRSSRRSSTAVIPFFFFLDAMIVSAVGQGRIGGIRS
jgi:hypothetical protein